MLRAVQIALAIAALSAPAFAENVSEGGAAATAELCADPGAFCGAKVSKTCLSRFGAGSLAVKEADCEEELATYSACIGQAAEQCGGAADDDKPEETESAAADRCTREDERELWDLAKEQNSCAGYEAFAQACPDGRRAFFAKSAMEGLGCGAKAEGAPQSGQPETAGGGATGGTASAPEEPPAPPAIGEAEYRSAQTELKRLRFYDGGIDGDWGPGSRAAMEAYQRKVGLPADGALTLATLEMLRAAETPPAPEPAPTPEPQASPEPAPTPEPSKHNGRNTNMVAYSQGTFERTSPGVWREYKTGADKPYSTWREVRRDEWSIFLRDDSRKMDMQIDLYRKQIRLGWPGRPLSDWAPVESASETATRRAEPPAPPKPETPTLRYNGRNTNMVRYSGGSFESSSSGVWREYKDGRSTPVSTWKEARRTYSSIYLRDESRRMTMVLDLSRRMIRLGWPGRPLSDWSRILEASTRAPSRPSVRIPVRPSRPATPSPSVSACKRAVQNRIAWDYKGSKRWAESTLNTLCSGNPNSTEPARCIQTVMHGGVSWGGGTRWQWRNAVDLCRGARSSSRVVSCFRSRISGGVKWPAAIQSCRGR